MALTKLEHDLVVLVDPSAAITGFDPKSIGKLLPGADAVGDGTALRLTSMRLQMILTLAADRLVFADKSDAELVGVPFPAAASNALATLTAAGMVTTGHGWNFKFEMAPWRPSGSAAAELATRFVGGPLLAEAGVNPEGAEVHLYFGESPRWTLVLEPRRHDPKTPDLFVHGNVHFDGPYEPTPSADAIASEGRHLFDEFMRMIDVLLR